MKRSKKPATSPKELSQATNDSWESTKSRAQTFREVSKWLSLIVLQFAILYPWVYTAFDHVLCHRDGSLAPMKLRCECPESRSGRRCETCIPETQGRGYCSGKQVVCYGKWAGPTCDFCPAQNPSPEICDSECNHTIGWYDNVQTGRCTFCNASTSCSGHGTCLPSGVCNCTKGYTGVGLLNLVGVSDCGLTCPKTSDGTVCNGHGACMPGGLCQCTGPWCGPDCTSNTVSTCPENTCDSTLNTAATCPAKTCDSSKPCSGNGYPVQVYDEKTNTGSKVCECECKLDRNGNAEFLGEFCQYQCPFGRGGIVCGGNQFTAKMNADGNKCKCECSTGSPLRDGPCESDCFYGGVETAQGECTCSSVYAISPCNRCEAGYFLPELGCSQHCVDGVTCQSGICGRSTHNNLVVQCNGCDGNREPAISTFVQLTEVQDKINAAAPYPISFGQAFLVPGETRELVLTHFSSSLKNQRPPSLSIVGNAPVLTLGSKDGATLHLDAQQTDFELNADTPYRLQQRIVLPLPTIHPYYVKLHHALYNENGTLVADFSSINSSAATACMELGQSCVGYSNYNGGELYSEICNRNAEQGCSTNLAPKNTFVIVDKIKLNPSTTYMAKVVDTLRRGCYACLKDYYPHPSITVLGDYACKTHCNRKTTCNNHGNCSDTGQCICDYPNMGPHCHNCTEGFYPAPDVGRKDVHPCSVQCNANAFPDPTRNMNACSGHGYCAEASGECICADSETTSRTNGWSGYPKGSACNIACAVGNSTNATSVCSNNGECINNACMCNDGYFGAHCQVTCNRDDQYFWIQKSLPPYVCEPSARGHGCDTGLACGFDGNQTCTRLTCNGGACTRRYQYEHVYDQHTFATKYYKSCNVSDVMERPLRECTALTEDQYDLLAKSSKAKNDTKAYIEQTMGIYCDVMSSPTDEDVAPWKTVTGLCARAVCDCSGRRKWMRKSATSRIEAIEGSTRMLPTGMPTGGPGCQYTGCEEAEFGTEGSQYQSMCGSLPPPAFAEGNALQVIYSSEQTGLKSLQNYLNTEVEQFCSFGECAPFNVSNPKYALGTKHNPVPSNAESAHGTCKCKNTPQVTDCHSDKVEGIDWPAKCCSGYYDPQATKRQFPFLNPLKDTSPYYGVSCGEQCSCANEEYWRGTCRMLNTGSTASMGLECTCRQGYRGKNTTVPVALTPFSNTTNTLFCGARCRYQCMGVINLATNQLTGHALSTHCPDQLAKDDMPALQKGCYRNIVPCWGHGTCVGAGQNCRLTRTVNSMAACACWGTDVNIANTDNNGVLTNQILLPPSVALYGGDDCQYPCPGVFDAPAGQLSAVSYFQANRQKLETRNQLISNRDVLEKFVEIYSTHVCSGHGYCQHGSPVVNRTLQCTCSGDWGGPTCNQRCTLPSFYWKNYTSGNGIVINPYQDINSSVAVENALTEEFGLDLCGPHACCGCHGSFEKTCQQDVRHFQHGSYLPISRWPVSSSPPIMDIYTYLSNLVPGAALLADFIEQWALAFVGPFSTCSDKHFSNVGVDASKGLHDELSGLPDIVRWHSTRSCDATYAQNQWQDNTPWCCSLAEDTLSGSSGIFKAWQDEAFVSVGSHGGCPNGNCPTFSTGRMCKQCVSSDYQNYLPVGKGGSCSTVEQYGYCNQCKPSGTFQRIAPYAQQNLSYWPNKCVTCVSSPLRKSGMQAIVGYKNPNNLVCNPVGTGLAPTGSGTNGCIGHASMYSRRTEQNEDPNVFSAPDGHSLLLGGNGLPSVATRLQLGLCKCSEHWNGPTCSMPKTRQACSGNGDAEPFEQSYFKYANEGETYSRCHCDSGHQGIYCEILSDTSRMSSIGDQDLGDFSDAVCNQDGTCVTRNCNGHGVIEDNGCNCDDEQLDPQTSCRDYKARGPNGVRTLHQMALLQTLEPLPNNGGAEYGIMFAILKAESDNEDLS